MRSIGEIKDKELAVNFCGYLNGISIPAEIEQDEPEGAWTIWVYNEDTLETARNELDSFHNNSTDPKYNKIAKEAYEQKRIQEKIDAKIRAKEIKLARRMRGANRFPVTYSLMGISIVTFFLMGTAEPGNLSFIELLFAFEKGVIAKGQVWRLLTPIFLHFGFMHIFFNMWWMLDLGRMIENRYSGKFLLIFVAIVGVASNICQSLLDQYLTGSQSLFGGMSGVIYGLLGYIWMKSKYQPESGLYIHPTTVTIMMIWLAFGFTGMMPIANGCHAGGLMIGTLWGYLSATVLSER